MKQYLELLDKIKKNGTYKAPARENMPGTTSLFGHQMRFDLQDGFPLLTTKKMYWKGVVVELIWFLRGDTNIKYLIDNGVNIWNEDAYNYYNKLKSEGLEGPDWTPEEFVSHIRDNEDGKLGIAPNYSLGDCGFQYGKVWRGGFQGGFNESEPDENGMITATPIYVDQIKNVIDSLKNSPTSRRHIVTAIDPGNDQDLALYWCHAMFQFNCRPLTFEERYDIWISREIRADEPVSVQTFELWFDENNIPKYKLDCQLYQRSADVFLGVPFNIASYALLTGIIAKMCNMIPGDFVHTFGDVHIYDNHMDAVDEQLLREPTTLPTLREDVMTGMFVDKGVEQFDNNLNIDILLSMLENYEAQPTIKAELSTGMKKQ